jgi:hypothetical protein
MTIQAVFARTIHQCGKKAAACETPRTISATCQTHQDSAQDIVLKRVRHSEICLQRMNDLNEPRVRFGVTLAIASGFGQN